MKHPVYLFLLCAAFSVSPQVQALTETSLKKTLPAIEPALERGIAIKRKVILTQFDVRESRHIEDINNAYDGFPDFLARKLEATGSFVISYNKQSLPNDNGDTLRKAVVRIAEDTGAQFVIGGRLHSAQINQHKGTLGQNDYQQRDVDIEFTVYDGLTGDKLFSRRFSDQAKGEMSVGYDKPFSSSSFLSTDYGQLINNVMEKATQSLQEGLLAIPFTARITRVAGKRVVFNAGSNVALRIGDSLVAYVRNATMPDGTIMAERAVDTAVVSFTQAQMSIAELTELASKYGLKAGDLIKFEPVERRRIIQEQITALQKAHEQQEALDTEARLKREAAAKAEAERIQAEKDAKAEAERRKAEAARIQAQKHAEELARAKAKAEAEKAAKVARLIKEKIRDRNSDVNQARMRANNYNKHSKLAPKKFSHDKRIREKQEAEKKQNAELPESDTIKLKNTDHPTKSLRQINTIGH